MTNLETLNKTQLLEVASNLSLNVSASATKQELFARVAETGVYSPFVYLARDELLAAAEELGVDHNPSSDTVIELLNAFKTDGITYDLYTSLHPEVVPEEEVLVATDVNVVSKAVTTPVGERLLLKMTRPNASMEIRGAKFTRENPYGLLPEEDAEYLINVVGGFQLALPSEAANYYK